MTGDYCNCNGRLRALERMVTELVMERYHNQGPAFERLAPESEKAFVLHVMNVGQAEENERLEAKRLGLTKQTNSNDMKE